MTRKESEMEQNEESEAVAEWVSLLGPEDCSRMEHAGASKSSDSEICLNVQGKESFSLNNAAQPICF